MALATAQKYRELKIMNNHGRYPLQISVSDSQFPRHIDFQKVGEVIIKNEKFNILKSTAHLVTDHFKDFMLGQGSADPGVRVLIDKNGFRHAWSGFGAKTKSLRKTDLKSKLQHISGSFENVSEKTPESGNTSTDGNDNDNTTATVDDSNENEQEEENNASGNNVTVHNLTEHTQSATLTHEMNSTEITIEKIRPAKNKTENEVGGRQGKKNKVPSNKQTTPKKKGITKHSQKNAKIKAPPKKPIWKERPVATTTFFCPFFGVITTSAFID